MWSVSGFFDIQNFRWALCNQAVDKEIVQKAHGEETQKTQSLRCGHGGKKDE